MTEEAKKESWSIKARKAVDDIIENIKSCLLLLK